MNKQVYRLWTPSARAHTHAHQVINHPQVREMTHQIYVYMCVLCVGVCCVRTERYVFLGAKMSSQQAPPPKESVTTKSKDSKIEWYI